MAKQTHRNRRLILVPCPYQGHITPMLQLATVLYSKSFSITIAHTISNSPNPQDHPHFTFLPMPDGFSDGKFVQEQTVANVLVISKSCKEFLRQYLEQQQEKLDENIACIISDEFMFFCEEVATDLKIPSIILRTTNATTSLARSGLVQLYKEGSVPCQDSQLYEMVPDLHPLRFKDLPFSLSAGFENFAFLIDKTYNKRKSSAVVWNTIECLEQSTLQQIQQKSEVPIFPIGPIHKLVPGSISSSLIEEDRSCLSSLDKQNRHSVIYVSSMGSLASLDEKEVAEIAWGLANSNQPFLWVIRPGSIRGSDWIELLPQGFQEAVGERGCIVKWAPQMEVLAHEAVGGFWSHCGWNSTLESIAEGVPMICKPCFTDQWVNARYLSHVWKVGIELEQLERGEIERVVRRLLLEEEGKELRARAQELKGKFEVGTREGGSSYNSLNELVNFIMSF
ncbi:hypothetical protein UlMin_013332 [Ulmus minor]